GSVPHRDGPADRDGGAAERPIRAHPAAIRHAPARRDDLARLFLLRPGGDRLRVLRLLSQRGAGRIHAALLMGRRVFFCLTQTRPGHGWGLQSEVRPSTPTSRCLVWSSALSDSNSVLGRVVEWSKAPVLKYVIL